ncbi:MAG: thiol-disulfide oxidoreductase [SAR116 cluster bacterium]|nr:thiol-disulfide oxidoreductase [SAR116 cluster bacterium]RPH08644.1 MAG: DUF393 domain-containing protein [Alphaproteobacteria bacterium TMED54]|tara:strand:- start:414 stop:782 length:369 start_codon:yes stop_codon:yes gene_type:complete
MIKVLYDGKCGLCNKEISYYKKIANSKIFEWLDIANNPKDLKQFNVKQSDALLYLHAFDADNIKYIGIDAFILIWKNLSYWKYLALIASLPIIKSLLSIIYNKFAHYRFNNLEHCKVSKNNA